MKAQSLHNMHFLALSCLLLLASCTSTEAFIEDASLDASHSARLVVYTPDTEFNRQNFIKPTIFIDGKKLDKVSIKEPLNVLIPTGKHSVAFQRSFPLMPVYEATKIDIDIKAQETYYIRYSYDFDDHIQNNGQPRTTGASSFRLVGKSIGEKRE